MKLQDDLANYISAGEAIQAAIERINDLENALRELRDNIGTEWTDEALKAFADRALGEVG